MMSDPIESSTAKSIEEWKAELAALRASLEAFSSDIDAFGHGTREVAAEDSPTVRESTSSEFLSASSPDSSIPAGDSTSVGSSTIDLTAFDDPLLDDAARLGPAEVRQPTYAHSLRMTADEQADPANTVPRSVDLRVDKAIADPIASEMERVGHVSGDVSAIPDRGFATSFGRAPSEAAVPVDLASSFEAIDPAAPPSESSPSIESVVGTTDRSTSGADNFASTSYPAENGAAENSSAENSSAKTDTEVDGAEENDAEENDAATNASDRSILVLPDDARSTPVGSGNMAPVAGQLETAPSSTTDPRRWRFGRGALSEITTAVNKLDSSRRRKIGALLLVGWLALIAVNMTAIRSKVENSLEHSSRQVLSINGQPGIKVAASGLTVTLSGFVDTPEEKSRAGELVKARFGVRRVVNKLVVDPALAAVQPPAESVAPQGDSNSTNAPKPGVATSPATTLPIRGPVIEVTFKTASDGTIGTVEVDGNVPDEAAKEALFARLSSAVSVEKILSNVQIPTLATERADMTSYRRLGSFLEIVAKTKSPNIKLTYEPRALAMSGSVGDANDLALIRAEARNLVGAGSISDTLLSLNPDGSPSGQTNAAVPTPSTTGGSTVTSSTVASSVTSSTVVRAVDIEGLGRTDTPAAQAAQTSVDSVISGKVIAFEKNKARLTTAGRAVLNSLAEVLLKSTDSTVKFEISGHTDDKGSESSNLDLSTRRAGAVREALIAKGVAADRLIAKGYGEAQPLAGNETEDGRSQNRRIEVRAAS